MGGGALKKHPVWDLPENLRHPSYILLKSWPAPRSQLQSASSFQFPRNLYGKSLAFLRIDFYLLSSDDPETVNCLKSLLRWCDSLTTAKRTHILMSSSQGLESYHHTYMRLFTWQIFSIASHRPSPSPTDETKTEYSVWARFKLFMLVRIIASSTTKKKHSNFNQWSVFSHWSALGKPSF